MFLVEKIFDYVLEEIQKEFIEYKDSETSDVFLHLETLKKFEEEQLKKKKRKRK